MSLEQMMQLAAQSAAGNGNGNGAANPLEALEAIGTIPTLLLEIRDLIRDQNILLVRLARSAEAAETVATKFAEKSPLAMLTGRG